MFERPITARMALARFLVGSELSYEAIGVLNDAVRKAAAARLTFDDEPAAFASVMAREAK